MDEQDDLYKAVSAFLICFGQSMPPELVLRIQHNTQQMALQMARAGDTNVSRLTKGLGDALGAMLPTH